MPNLKLNKKKLIETLEFIIKNDAILKRSYMEHNNAEVI